MSRARILAALLLTVVGFCWPQVVVDRLHLADGTVFDGVILEHRPGEYLLVGGADARLRCLPDYEVVSVERALEQRASETHSVFFLDDGVIVRGHLSGYAPGATLTVLVDGEIEIVIPADRVVKTMHVRSPLPDPGEQAVPAREVRREAAALEVELALPARSRDAPDDDETDEEATTLEKEIEELERGLQAAEEDAAAAEAEENRERVAVATADARAALEEMVGLAAACEEAGPVRTKGTGAAGLSDADRVALLEAATREPSSSADRSLDELALAATGGFDELEQRATNPAASPRRIDELAAEARATEQAARLLERRKPFNRLMCARVGSMCADLPEETRRQLYESYRHRDTAAAAARNVLPVLNWGSWRQGDRLHALVTGGASIVAYTTAVVIFGAGYAEVGSLELREVSGGWQAMPPPSPLANLGVALAGVTFAYSVARPLVFSHVENRRLAEALGLETRGLQW